jgi:Enoyl reductase domain of yeast-type FAS1
LSYFLFINSIFNGLYYYGYSKNESTKISANGIQWLVGICRSNGKEVIPFIYDDARYFNKDGKAKVKLNGETFFIDVKGNRVE